MILKNNPLAVRSSYIHIKKLALLMTGWLLRWVIFSNECALIVLIFLPKYINFIEIDVRKCVMRKPHKISQLVFSV